MSFTKCMIDAYLNEDVKEINNKIAHETTHRFNCLLKPLGIIYDISNILRWSCMWNYIWNYRYDR
jgi:hypothetical protein